MDAESLTPPATPVPSRGWQSSAVVTMGVVPAALYLAGFILLTWPAIARFHSHLFADDGDGFQNVWNLWLMNRTVTVLHQFPWHTTYLHYPYGTSLLGHTLNPFNGLIAIVLLPFMSLTAAHNSIVVLSFVSAGVTAFLLACYVTASYWPSLMAGFIFTFSNYHFSHAEGHLQLVSLEWIPLFLLLWLRLIATPRTRLAVAAALVLFLVILCDYYYFLYSAIAGVVALAWTAFHDGLHVLVDRRRLAALATFVAVAAATSGVLIAALLWANIHDPLLHAHAPEDFSLDLLSPIIYGGHWRFGWLTSAYWTRLRANYHESSVHLGMSMIGLVAYVWMRRRDVNAIVGLFYVQFAVFLIAALGPTLQIAGKEILPHRLFLPYQLLEFAFPPLALSGVPIRMIVMVVLSGAIICAFGFTLLLRGGRTHRLAAAVVACLLVVEYLPRPIPTVQPIVPGYVTVLKNLPGDDGVIDLAVKPSVALLYQTVHEKPLALGYPIARLPLSVEAQDREVEGLLQRGEFERLWRDYRLRYVVTADADAALKHRAGTRTLWDDGRVALYDVSETRPR